MTRRTLLLGVASLFVPRRKVAAAGLDTTVKAVVRRSRRIPLIRIVADKEYMPLTIK